jgi:competence protein ComEC
MEIYFLNVGQGDSTYIRYEGRNKTWHLLIDCNLDYEHHGIDVIRFLKDEIPEIDGTRLLDYLIVTHPHEDHIKGLGRVGEECELGELWDSGHVPSDTKSDHYRAYEDLKGKYEDVLREWKMSRTPVDICDGELRAHVLSPSRWVKEEEEMTAEERREAIHDECMVIKLIFGDFYVLFTGDSNKSAWQRIVGYEQYDDETHHSHILHASHHGSRTFFKKDKEDEEFRDAIEKISPDDLIISVSDPSPHDHPHEDAMEIYRKHVSKDRIYQTSNGTVICYVSEDGEYSLDYDDGGIQDNYQLPDTPDDDNGNGNGGKDSHTAVGTVSVIRSRTRIDDKPAA